VLTAQQAHASAKFRLQKTVVGDLTYLTLHGVIDEGFEGRKQADAIRTKKVVLNLRDVRRFASWGMAEWTDFVKTNAARDVYLAECSTQALSQFNLVTGLSGHAKIVSFYVPYRCASCGEESESLLVAPIDRATLLSLAEHEQP
jgi:ABC-type transporter Mla MlaB component